MTHFYLSPIWFSGFDVALELVFGIITFALALVSYKVYRLSQQRSVKLYSLSFLLISASYILWAAINLLVVQELTETTSSLSLEGAALLTEIGIYAHMFFFIIGLATLAYTTFNLKSGGVYYLITGLSILVIAASLNKYVTFRILSTFLLAFIAYHYLLEYLSDRKSTGKKLLLTSFAFLLISSLDFIFSPFFYQAYVLGHFLELAAYSFILTALVKTLRK